MTAFEAIQTALSQFGFPCVPNLYTGKEQKYFRYNYAAINGGDFGDNMPGCNVTSVQVHLFYPLKEDYLATMRSVQRALFDHDFTWPRITVLDEYAEVEAESAGKRQGLDGVRHIVFECEYEETVD